MALAGGAAAAAAAVLRGRWIMAYASFLIMSAAGATYIFAIYSKQMKTVLGYTQEQLNTVGFFKDLGANVGIHAGLIGELTPPWVVLLIGAAMNLGGYLMAYLSLAGAVAKPPLWLMCLYIAVGANSQAFANTGALVACVKNFPESRGIVLGLLKGFVGLSGAIFTQLYLAIYGNVGAAGNGGDTKGLLLLIAVLPAGISLAFLGVIRIISSGRRSSGDRQYKAFCNFLYITLALAGYLLVIIVLQKRYPFTRAEYAVSAAVVVLLLLLPVVVSVKEELYLLKQEDASPAEDVGAATTVTATAAAAAAETSDTEETLLARAVRALKSPEHGEDYTILQAVVSIDMILLFVAAVFGIGGMLTAIDNMGQIGESQGYPAQSTATFVSLLSIWNYLGRVGAGFLSEALIARRRTPRPLVLAAFFFVSCAGHLLIAFGVPGALYPASILIGTCFGAGVPLILAIISELFGLKYYSTMYNLGNLAFPVGSYILNVRVAGRMYDEEAKKDGVVRAAGKALTCIGVSCYKRSFLIIAAVTAAAAAVLLVLTWRTRQFYAGDIYARFRAAPAAAEEEDEEK